MKPFLGALCALALAAADAQTITGEVISCPG